MRAATGAATVTGALAGLALGLAPGIAGAHLFHQSYAPPETQLTRDTRTLQLLLDDPAERFDLARRVWEGELRLRPGAGGARRWLVRSSEPGVVFKTDYQRRWSGSLRSEAERIDHERGTDLARRLETALARRDRDGARAGLRQMYVVFLDELLAALWDRLDDAETAERLYQFVLAYWSVNLEAYFAIRHPVAGAVAQTALDAMLRALGDAGAGVPPAPEAFDKQRRRFLRILREAVPVS